MSVHPHALYYIVHAKVLKKYELLDVYGIHTKPEMLLRKGTQAFASPETHDPDFCFAFSIYNCTNLVFEKITGKSVDRDFHVIVPLPCRKKNHYTEIRKRKS